MEDGEFAPLLHGGDDVVRVAFQVVAMFQLSHAMGEEEQAQPDTGKSKRAGHGPEAY